MNGNEVSIGRGWLEEKEVEQHEHSWSRAYKSGDHCYRECECGEIMQEDDEIFVLLKEAESMPDVLKKAETKTMFKGRFGIIYPRIEILFIGSTEKEVRDLERRYLNYFPVNYFDTHFYPLQIDKAEGKVFLRGRRTAL